MRKTEALALAKLVGYNRPNWFKCRECQRHIIENEGAVLESVCWICFGEHRSLRASGERWMIVPVSGRNAIFMRGLEPE